MAITREAFETHCKPRIAQYAALWLIGTCDQKHLDDTYLKFIGINLPRPRKWLKLKADVGAEMLFLLSAGV